MTAHARQIANTTPDQVWAVLADGWMYSAWVVGASHLRAVEPQWPQVGSKIHHSVGLWPAVVKDRTTVTASEPDTRLVLDVAIWFLGRGTVDIELREHGHGQTEILMREEMHRGLLAKLPAVAVDPPITVRNVETLHRLAAIAERRTEP